MVGVIGLAELLSLQDLGTDVNFTIRTILDSSQRLLQNPQCLAECVEIASLARSRWRTDVFPCMP